MVRREGGRSGWPGCVRGSWARGSEGGEAGKDVRSEGRRKGEGERKWARQGCGKKSMAEYGVTQRRK